ncbi:MAG: hypothetical protein COB02_10925 [Candidatus Cloacimonadota bacterium]|nr:MAG: hypothetical protein COB02_10925 [Candidatus Cloacimonadota bacterium]
MWSTSHQEFLESYKDFIEFFPSFDFKVLSSQKSHAFCLNGHEIANLFSFSSQFILHLLCDDINKPCMKCNGCRAYLKQDVTRFISVFPLAQTISIKKIRLILSNLGHRLAKGERQVIAIYYPALMAKEAANALLKVLEEPPEGRVFVLVNPNQRFLLPTISSRLTHIHLPSAEVIKNNTEDEYLIGRFSDFNLIVNHEKVIRVIERRSSLSKVYYNFSLKIKDEKISIDKLLSYQLINAEMQASRKIAIIEFLEQISSLGYLYLEKELFLLKSSIKELEKSIQISLMTKKRTLQEELGKDFSHWLLEDFSTQKIDTFVRGFVRREIEILFVEVLKVLEFLLVDHREIGILSSERQIALNYAVFSESTNLFELSEELTKLQRMLHNNISWDSLLEYLGLYFIKSLNISH